MPFAPLGQIEIREAVHLLILRRLTSLADGGAVTLKGGVNLRLFFASPRYSEDLDLDGEASFRPAIRNVIGGIFKDSTFLRELRRLGLRGLNPGEGPNKDTETVFRYKFRVIGPADVEHPTKVEVSFRGRYEADGVLRSPLPPALVARYAGSEATLAVGRYDRPATVRQKLEALAGRSAVQARDVFDLRILDLERLPDREAQSIARQAVRRTLEAARERAIEIPFDAFAGQVGEFLADRDREAFVSKAAWDDMRLHVAAGIERLLKLE